MLLVPQNPMDQHVNAREGLAGIFNDQMEDILNEHKHLDTYWILGKVSMHRKGDKHIAKPFLQACLVKPGVIKKSFVYEVDNRRGVKTLLWVMHPDDTLSFPTLGKSIRVTGDKSGSTILLPK